MNAARRRSLIVPLAAILAGAVIAMLATPTAPAHAAGQFTGGALSSSALAVPNDHTPVAIQYSATGLDPNASYRLKVRLSPAPEPMNIQNRGWTWNPESRRWIQEREQDKNRFPLVVTDASGTVPNGEATYAFGDEGASGRYYILISLNLEKGATFNGSQPLAVDVFDARTEGARLHNSAATALPAGALIRAVRRSDGVTIASSRVETDGVDSDIDGVVDDEDHGPVGTAGDYSLCVPIGVTFDVVSEDSTIVAGASLSHPDEDIAMGAVDMSAPTSPTMLTGVARDRAVRLSWSPAIDDTGVTHYLVYRWMEPPLGVPYSASKVLVGQTSATTFDDLTPRGGLTYRYEVRAVDAATNMSGRSNSVQVTTLALPPTVRATLSPSRPDGASGWYRRSAPRITLRTDRGRLYYSWDSSTSVYATYTAPLRAPQGARTLFYYAADSDGNESAIARVTVRTDTRAPSTRLGAPLVSTRTSANRSYVVTFASSDATPSSGTLRDVEYRTSASARWRRLRTRTAAVAATITAPPGSTYRFRARSSDRAGNVGAWTAARATSVPFDDSAARFSGRWSTETTSVAYGGRSRVTTASGASATFTVSGTGEIRLIAPRGPDHGSVRVYIDGRSAGTVSLAAATDAQRADIRLGRLTRSGRHTVRLIASVPTGRRVAIDGLSLAR